jgi:hypothetical protein
MDTRAYVTVAQHRQRMAQKTARPTLHTADSIWGTIPFLKEVILTLILGWCPLRMLVFVANITNKFILGLDILHTWCICEPRAPNTVSCRGRSITSETWAGPWPSSPVVANDQVITCTVRGTGGGSIGEPPWSGKWPRRTQFGGPFAWRTLHSQDSGPGPPGGTRGVLNATRYDQKLTSGSPQAHSEPVTLVTPRNVEQPQV